MIMRKKISIFLILAILIAASNISAKEFTFDYQKIFDVGTDEITIDLKMFNGSIEVVGEETDRVIIEAVKTIRASNDDEAQEVADHIEIKPERDGSTIKIHTNYLRMIERSPGFWEKLFGTSESKSYGNVAYKLIVPINTNLNLMSTDAEILVSSVEGDVVADNHNGSFIGEYIFGDITLSQPTGEVDLEWIEGDIRVKSLTARIKIIQIVGAIDLSTLSGPVNIQTELESPKNYFIETSSGLVSFSIPVTASGKLSIETDTGRIKTDVPLSITTASRRHQVSEFGQDGPKVDIVTSTGDVEVSVY